MNWTVCQQGVSIIKWNIWQHDGDPWCPSVFCGPQQQHLRACRKLTISVRSPIGPWIPSSLDLNHQLPLLECPKSNLTNIDWMIFFPTPMFIFPKFPVSSPLEISWNTVKIQWVPWQLLNSSPSCLSRVTLGRIAFKVNELTLAKWR